MRFDCAVAGAPWCTPFRGALISGRYPNQTGAVANGNLPWRGVVTRDGWKYACTPGADWLLFNLAEDPFEQANQVFNERYRAEKERCHRLLGEWIETTGDRFPLPDIALHERGTPAAQYRQHLARHGRDAAAGVGTATETRT